MVNRRQPDNASATVRYLIEKDDERLTFKQSLVQWTSIYGQLWGGK